MNTPEIIELASDLISFRSLSGSEGPITDFLVETLSARGWKVERLAVAENRDNLFVSFGTPEIVFTTHTDVVPGPDRIFSPQVRNGRIYGRGACDTKGIIATMVAVVDRLRSQGLANFGLLFVVGEELDGIGARTAAKQLQGRGVRYIINGEPTERKVMRGHKGGLGIEIACEGVACHSGYPDAGDDANEKLIRTVARILEAAWPEDPVFGATTVNCGVIRGGVAGNIISPSAEATVLFRTVCPNELILAAVEKLLLPPCSMKVAYDSPLVSLLHIPGMESDVAAFCTDIPYFAPLGAQCVLYGPGSILAAHTDDEHIAIDEIERAVDGYEHIFHHLRNQPLGS